MFGVALLVENRNLQHCVLKTMCTRLLEVFSVEICVVEYNASFLFAIYLFRVLSFHILKLVVVYNSYYRSKCEKNKMKSLSNLKQTPKSKIF